MKKKIISCLIILALLIASFFTGSYVREQKNLNARIRRCLTFVSFALDKAENEDYSDQAAMKALASNIYAAYQYCDDDKAAAQLHDLWNYVLKHSDEEGAKDVVIQELRGVRKSYKAKEK